MMAKPNNATLVRVVDGDTIVVNVHLCNLFGGELWVHNIKCRLARINAPEMKVEGKPNPAGLAAKEFLTKTLATPGELAVDMLGADKYAREDVEVWLGGVSINDMMVATGHAVVYQRELELMDQDQEDQD